MLSRTVFCLFPSSNLFLKKSIKLKDQALEVTTIGELSSGGEMMAAVEVVGTGTRKRFPDLVNAGWLARGFEPIRNGDIL